jgi:hypothetical protein
VAEVQQLLAAEEVPGPEALRNGFLVIRGILYANASVLASIANDIGNRKLSQHDESSLESSLRAVGLARISRLKSRSSERSAARSSEIRTMFGFRLIEYLNMIANGE